MTGLWKQNQCRQRYLIKQTCLDYLVSVVVQDMKKRGRITANTKVSWTVTVDPAIMGGCIYRMGDVELDCSKRSLEAEFYAGLEAEGIARIA